jgi:hypothetical protein
MATPNAYLASISNLLRLQATNPTKAQLDAAKALGIKKIDNPAELTRIDNYIAAFEKTKTDPVYTQAAKGLGIKDYNSVNDYAQVVNKLSGGPAPKVATPAPAAPPPPPTPAYTPKPLVAAPEEPPPPAAVPLPPPPEQKFSPGGSSSELEGGAMGFRRKKSSARLAGLTTKGTSQFKINGQTAKSSGLNIGV